MIYFNNKKINKIYQDGSLTNKIDMAFEEAEPSRLPEGYTEVEYIENASSAYIDTNAYIDTSNFEVGSTIIGERMSFGYGHNNVANGTWIGVLGTNTYFGRYTSPPSVNISSYLTSGENTIVYTKSGVTVNGTTISSSFRMGSDSIANISLAFFTYYDFYTNEYKTLTTTFKIKSFYLKNNGTLVRDLVPCKRDSDSKYGMYDLVSNSFFVSPNDVNFIGGNPVTPPAPVTPSDQKSAVTPAAPTPASTPTPASKAGRRCRWTTTRRGG